MKKLPAILFAAAAAMVMCSCGDADISSVTMEGEKIKSASKGVKVTAVTDNITKTTGNPLISNIFCADPTAVEYEGRLYVYGTNDQQQYEAVGAEGSNTYEHIKSLVMLSTDDMVNWTYHGTIDVGEISPWAIASWAPSVVSRVEEDGKTHFYLYYSNSGWGVAGLPQILPQGHGLTLWASLSLTGIQRVWTAAKLPLTRALSSTMRAQAGSPSAAERTVQE